MPPHQNMQALPNKRLGVGVNTHDFPKKTPKILIFQLGKFPQILLFRKGNSVNYFLIHQNTF